LIGGEAEISKESEPGFTIAGEFDIIRGMSTITAVLDADPDGTLHLPLPLELRKSKVKVVATLEAAQEKFTRPTLEEAQTALQTLQKLGTFKAIKDPMKWQREIRKDRPLPGRE
jgi:hypothetical protein